MNGRNKGKWFMKVNDRVTENGRHGTIVAFHTKGTVDVHFDDMDHEIRRQIGQVKPLRQNGRVTQVPLLIACSGTKTGGKKPAFELYDGSLWRSFRKHAPQPSDRDIPIYALSAKYGIIPYDHAISDYDLRIVGNNKRFYKEDEIKEKDVAEKIRKQWNAGTVLFAGGKHYKNALRQAGFEVIAVEDLTNFPNKNASGGVGKQRQALNWLLSTYLPSQRK